MIRFIKKLWNPGLVSAMLLCLLLAGIAVVSAPKTANAAYPTGYAKSSSLKVYASKNTKSDVVVKLSKYENVTILEQTDNWYKVNANHKDVVYRGYVKTSKIVLNTVKNPLKKGYIKKKTTLRKTPESEGKKVVSLSVNDKVTKVKGIVGKWYKVTVKHKSKTYTGYVLRSAVSSKKVEDAKKDNTSSSSTSNKENQKTEENPKYSHEGDNTGKTGYVNNEYLNLRKEASTKSDIVVVLAYKDKVDIVKDLGGWYQVKAHHDGKTYKGYVADWYITIE